MSPRARTRKVRHRGGGGNNRLGLKAQSMKTMKRVKNHLKSVQKAKRAANRAQMIEERRRSSIVGQNVETLFETKNGENTYKKLTDDPEYVDQIFASFCKFLEDLQGLEEQAEREGNSDVINSISIQKLQIAEVLLTNFGKKKGVVQNMNESANNFGANLANILSRVKL